MGGPKLVFLWSVDVILWWSLIISLCWLYSRNPLKYFTTHPPNPLPLMFFFLFFFFWDRRPTDQHQSTEGNWPPSKYPSGGEEISRPSCFLRVQNVPWIASLCVSSLLNSQVSKRVASSLDHTTRKWRIHHLFGGNVWLRFHIRFVFCFEFFFLSKFVWVTCINYISAYCQFSMQSSQQALLFTIQL